MGDDTSFARHTHSSQNKGNKSKESIGKDEDRKGYTAKWHANGALKMLRRN